MRSIKDYINESTEQEKELLPDTERYAVIFTGGSMSDAQWQTFKCGSDRCSVMMDNLTQEEAKETAKLFNSNLSAGDKKYYRMKYKAVLSTKIKPIK